MVRIWVASLHQKIQCRDTLDFCFTQNLKFRFQGWIRTAAEPTAACGGNREARLGQRSAFSKPCQEAAEKAPAGLFQMRGLRGTRAHQELQHPNRVLEFLFYLCFFKCISERLPELNGNLTLAAICGKIRVLMIETQLSYRTKFSLQDADYSL